jgi:hypothetical protein
MDQRIRETLQEEAEQVQVAPDAWATQQARLRRLPSRRRWVGITGEVLVVCTILALLVAPALRGRLQGPPPPAQPTQSVNRLRPAPSPQVIIPPDRPPVTPPAGFLPQADAEAKAVALLRDQTQALGQFELTRARIEGDLWLFTFTARLPMPNLTSGGKRQASTPILEQRSPLSFLSEIEIGLNGPTGERYSVQQHGGTLGATPPNLELLEGRLVTGGAQSTLRLFRPDGRPEADLRLYVPEQALLAGGLRYWELLYGSGKRVKVWGQTIGERAVLAYKVQWLDPAPEPVLTAIDLSNGIPIMPGGEQISGTQFRYAGSDRGAAVAWYFTQMERYGWHLVAGVPRSAESAINLIFQNQAQREATVRIHEVDGGVEIELTATDTPERFPNAERLIRAPGMDAKQALAHLLTTNRGIATFAEFPSTPTWRDVEINVGGPYPGVTIPVRFESVVSPGTQTGSFKVLLVKRWGEKDARWYYEVAPTGEVTLISFEGEDLPNYR